MKNARKNPLKTLAGQTNLQRINNFDWNDILEEIQTKLPVTYAFLDGALPPLHVLKKGKSKGRKKAKMLFHFHYQIEYSL